MNVGFIGLGRMGTAMAGSLLRAGHEVTVYDRTPSKAQALIGRGAHLAKRVVDGLPGDAVVTMLADRRIRDLAELEMGRLNDVLLFVSRHTVPKELRLAEMIVKLLASCSNLLSLDARGSGRELSMFDKLDAAM